MIRNTQLICLITLCLDMMIYDTYGQTPENSICNICNTHSSIKYPGNNVNVTFLGFDDNVQDTISCQQLYDAGMTHYITAEQCLVIHTHENGIQLQTFCGCSSEVIVPTDILLKSTPLESSTSLSQLKVLALIKEPETKGVETLSNVTIPPIDENSTEILQHESSNETTTDHHTMNVTVDDNVTQDVEAYVNITGEPVVVGKPTKQTDVTGKKSKSPVVAGGKLKPTVLKPSKIPIDATVATPTVAGAPVVKKSPTAQSMSSVKPNLMKPTSIDKPSKIKDIKEGKVPVVAVSAPSTPTTTTVEMPTTIITKPISNPMKMSLGDVKR